MSLRPWRWRTLRTLHGRLIAGLVVLLAIACASVGGTSYIAVRGELFNEVNNRLQTATTLTFGCEDQSADPQPGNLMYCIGLADGTFVASFHDTKWTANLVPSKKPVALTAAEIATLRSLDADAPPAPQSESISTYHVTLPSAGGTFVLTAVRDPDGTLCYTGLPLHEVYDTLSEIELIEVAIFAGVLLAAAVLGTVWVRLSLRPLQRVARVASQVAELPLESGEVELPKGVPYTDPDTETGQVGSAFNRMLGHVQQALARRAASEARLRRFAADASHELRTPLSAIRGYAELALRQRGEAPEPVTHALGRVLSESTRMSVLVDDLLLLARLDAGRPLAREPVDVTRLAIDATSDARVARPDHRWVLDLPDDPVQVRGDEHRLHQVLANLLSNAGGHTPEGTTVTVLLTADAEAPGDDTVPDSGTLRGTVPPVPRTVITVTDDGPGIPPELLPDLFERFTRADTARSHATDAHSTGLGLAIVDAVVAAHGGATLVTSRPGKTSFAIVLPRLAEDTASDENPRPARKSRA
jgi:two-component system, OmpR family, sensor kinase